MVRSLAPVFFRSIPSQNVIYLSSIITSYLYFNIISL